MKLNNKQENQSYNYNTFNLRIIFNQKIYYLLLKNTFMKNLNKISLNYVLKN